MSQGSLESLRLLLEAGATPAVAAARLGLSDDLVRAMVDELERLGVVDLGTGRAGQGCSTCTPSPMCLGCPVALSHRRGIRTTSQPASH